MKVNLPFGFILSISKGKKKDWPRYYNSPSWMHSDKSPFRFDSSKSTSKVLTHDGTWMECGGWTIPMLRKQYPDLQRVNFE